MRRRKPHLNHLARALHPGRFQTSPETYLEAVDYLANASPDAFYKAFDAALEPVAEWQEGQIAAERNRLEEERRRAGVREQPKPVAPEPTPDPKLRPPHTRSELTHADRLGRLYAAKAIGEQLESKRARLASAVDLVQGGE